MNAGVFVVKEQAGVTWRAPASGLRHAQPSALEAGTGRPQPRTMYAAFSKGV
jgi:hypothetical protein